SWLQGSGDANQGNPPVKNVIDRARTPEHASDLLPERGPPAYLAAFREARAVNLSFSLLAGAAVALLGLDLFGPAASLAALLFWCANPFVIAWASLVTTDMGATASMLLFVLAFRAHLRQPTLATSFTSGVLLGLALLCKFSALVLVPFAFSGRRLVPLLATALLVVNAGYLFQGTGRVLGSFTFWSGALGSGGNHFAGTPLHHLPVPVPADFLLGLDRQWLDTESGLYESWFLGELRKGGWPHYYLVGLALKLPLGLLAAFFLALCFARRLGKGFLVASVPSLLLLALLSWRCGFCHHLRYALPAVPLVCIAAGALFSFGWRMRLVGALCLLQSVFACFQYAPHHLPYFNELAGGPQHGWKALADSSADWGQGLLDLRDWARANPDKRPLHLACFNRVDPALFGIDFVPPPSDPDAPPIVGGASPPQGPIPPGWHVVSANFVVGIPFIAPDGKHGWMRVPPRAYARYRKLTPVGHIGYSLLVYRVPEEDEP
ncbi:MAG: glycosyltransferase family 39 protein, partial [Gemmataceae bacterium]|nr:glycosyltransferase family 39 protein [Gemmataceae bacterium]